jgi:Calcineurin-like phosphoesterase
VLTTALLLAYRYTDIIIMQSSIPLLLWLILSHLICSAIAASSRIDVVAPVSNVSDTIHIGLHHDLQQLQKSDESILFNPAASASASTASDDDDGKYVQDDGDIIGGYQFPSKLYHSRQEPFRSFPCYPKYIHLAQASNMVQQGSNETTQWVINMTVSFALDYAACACAVPTIVYGGPVGNDSDRSASPYNSQYHLRSHSNEKVAKLPVYSNPLQFNYTSDKTKGRTYQSDWIYHIPMKQLVGGLQTYWYRIIVTERNDCPNYIKQRNLHLPITSQPQQQRRSLRGSNGYYLGETKIYTFLTPPVPGQATSLALVGDLGQTMNSAQTIYHIYSKTSGGVTRKNDSYSATDNELVSIPPISQLLIAGDLSYADSDPERWTTFLELIEPLVRTLPLHVVAGNHEIECDTTKNLFVPYENWFHVPNRIQDAITEPITDEYKQTLWDHSCSAPSVFQGVYNYGNSFYSFQHGLVYMIVLNSYSKCTKGSVQYEWLLSELEKYRQNNYRRPTPWLLISFHAPLYTTFLGHVDEKQSVEMKDALEAVFIEYGVNIIVSGKLLGDYSCSFLFHFHLASILTLCTINFRS